MDPSWWGSLSCSLSNEGFSRGSNTRPGVPFVENDRIVLDTFWSISLDRSRKKGTVYMTAPAPQNGVSGPGGRIRRRPSSLEGIHASGTPPSLIALGKQASGVSQGVVSKHCLQKPYESMNGLVPGAFGGPHPSRHRIATPAA